MRKRRTTCWFNRHATRHIGAEAATHEPEKELNKMQTPPVAQRRAAVLVFSGGDAPESTVRRRAAQQKIRCSPRFRHLVSKVHALGPRLTAEAMLAVATGGDIMSVLSVYAEIDEQLLDAFDGCRWPPGPLEAVG